MLLEILLSTHLIIPYIIITLIIFLFMFKWLFKEIRDICKRVSGVIIFGQIMFMILSWVCFIGILIYFVFFEHTVNALNIFLTIVVGFLGTMIGLFFSRDIVKHLEDKIDTQKRYSKKSLLKDKNVYDRIIKKLSEEEKS